MLLLAMTVGACEGAGAQQNTTSMVFHVLIFTRVDKIFLRSDIVC